VNYPIKTTIPQNSKVYVYQIRTDGWAYTKYNGSYGYLFSQYLSDKQLATGLPVFQRNYTSLLEIIKACKAYYAKNNFVYNLADGARTIPADLSKLYNNQYYCVDCSSFVTWVLYEYALAHQNSSMKSYFSYQRSSNTFASIGANGGNAYLEVVSQKGKAMVDLSLTKPGDIIVSPGHVEFFDSYTQNGTEVSLRVYNCGSNASVRTTGVSTSATRSLQEITYILRVRGI
jgi:hypothetical protein